MQPTDFENLVKAVLLDQLHRSGIQVHRGKHFRGKRSGYEHEIDLSFEIDLVGTQVLVVVECKAYRRPVSVDDVLEFCSRIDDIGAHKGILASTSGFTLGARTLASSNGVALVRALQGRWKLICHGDLSCRPSAKYFDLARARIVVSEDGPRLQLGLVDEVDLEVSRVSWRSREDLGRELCGGRGVSQLVLQVVSSGGSVSASREINLSQRSAGEAN